MSLYGLLSPTFRHRDERGELVQLVRGGWEQVNVLCSYKGAVRGGHYHKICREAFYVVSGSVNLTLWQGPRREDATFRAGDFFEIPPGTVHEMSFPEDCVLVALYDRPVETPSGKDIYPAEPRS